MDRADAGPHRLFHAAAILRLVWQPGPVKQTMRRRLVDLPAFGRPVATMWRQVR